MTNTKGTSTDTLLSRTVSTWSVEDSAVDNTSIVEEPKIATCRGCYGTPHTFRNQRAYVAVLVHAIGSLCAKSAFLVVAGESCPAQNSDSGRQQRVVLLVIYQSQKVVPCSTSKRKSGGGPTKTSN